MSHVAAATIDVVDVVVAVVVVVIVTAAAALVVLLCKKIFHLFFHLLGIFDEHDQKDFSWARIDVWRYSYETFPPTLSLFHPNAKNN